MNFALRAAYRQTSWKSLHRYLSSTATLWGRRSWHRLAILLLFGLLSEPSQLFLPIHTAMICNVTGGYHEIPWIVEVHCGSNPFKAANGGAILVAVVRIPRQLRSRSVTSTMAWHPWNMEQEPCKNLQPSNSAESFSWLLLLMEPQPLQSWPWFLVFKGITIQRNQRAWHLLPTRLVFSTPRLPLGTSCAQMKAGKGYERIW